MNSVGSIVQRFKGAMDPISLFQGIGNVSSPGGDEQIVQTKVLVIYVGGTIGMKEVDGVLKPVPDYMSGLLKSLPMFYDEVAAAELQLGEDEFVLPVIDSNLRIIYHLNSFDPLKDSSNLVIHDWIDMVTVINDNYSNYHGFVILHGTDTMAYTSSALSFMLQNLGKPVVITGAQIPLSKFRSDGIDNMLGSLYIAGKYDIPEVGLFFNSTMYRGNRALKRSSEDLKAYASPNFPPLVEININAEVHWENIFHPKPSSAFSVSTSMNDNIGMLTFFPGITAATVRAGLSDPIKGVVLRSYGAGNGPNQEDIINAITDACNRGVIILNTTQCYEGEVSAAYETGEVLIEAGVIPGSDSTPEAALTKLCYVLGKQDLTLQEQKDLLTFNLRGEITVSHTHEKGLTLKDNKFANAVSESLRLTSGEEAKAVKRALFPTMIAMAVANDDMQQLQQLQSCGGDLNAGDLDGRTPLAIAASRGRIGMVKYLLQEGCSVLARDRFGNTPFTESIRNKNLEIVKLLRKAGGHLIEDSKTVNAAVSEAVNKDDKEALECYRAAGIDLKLTE